MTTSASPFVYVKFSSGRSRECALQVLNRLPQAYWSLRRQTGAGGVYALTEPEIRRLTGEHLVHFTRLRGPFDDLMECGPVDLDILKEMLRKELLSG